MTASIAGLESVRIASGNEEAIRLIDMVLDTEHRESETLMYIGDRPYFQTEKGPYPNHQLRVSARPSTGYAALHYTDHDDLLIAMAISWNARRPLPEVDLIFNSATGAVFPRTAAIPIADAREALCEWIETCKRPTCIEWRPYDMF